MESPSEKVLVIDDSPLALNLVRDALEAVGFAVQTASDGPEGLARLATFQPDVVLCDLQMPGMSGIEVVAQASARFPETPVVMFTESSTVSTAVEAMQAGAYGYLVKGQPEADLVRELRAAIQRRRLAERARRLEEENRLYRENLEKLVEEKAAELVRVRDAKARELAAANEHLRQAQGNFMHLTAETPTPIVIHRGGVALYANPALVTLLGYESAEELEGKAPLELMDETDRERLRAWMAADVRKEKRASPSEFRARHRSGRALDLELHSTPVLFEGAPACLVLVQDLTEKKQLSSRLMQVDRMAAVGTLAAGVAHEINNPLAYVHANVQFVEHELATLEPGAALEATRLADIKGALAETRTGLDRVNQIVRDLKGLSRQDEQRVPVELRTVIESAARMVSATVRQRASLVLDLGDLPIVSGNPGRLGQVVLNLVVNAVQAIPEGNQPGNEVRVTARTEAGRAVIEVRDTGAGMSAEVQRRLFEPFFTTKAQGVGTGLGLSICRSIIESHAGSISVDSAPGRGSTFRVELPAQPRVEARR